MIVGLFILIIKDQSPSTQNPPKRSKSSITAQKGKNKKEKKPKIQKKRSKLLKSKFIQRKPIKRSWNFLI